MTGSAPGSQPMMVVAVPSTVTVRAGAPGAGVTVGGGTALVASAVQGPMGPQGPPGLTVTLAIQQPAPATSWTLAHNLGRWPSITLVDSAGDQIWGDVTYLDDNNARVRFGYPTSGTAYLI